MSDHIGWGGIARLGCVQAALGAVVVITTSTLNRVMVVELALPALLPGLLVALHYLVQVARPRMGHGSDIGGRRSPWIVGGMAVLAAGGLGASAATAWMATQPLAGLALAVASFAAVGLGVAAAGTSLLVLLAKRVAPQRRAAAATIVWMMMIAGFAITAGVAGTLLDPYSPARLVAVTAGVGVVALVVAVIALHGVEGRATGSAATVRQAPAASSASPSSSSAASTSPSAASFREALAQVWAEPAARRFTIFVFVSMLAFSAQDLILEPFAGIAFGFTPGESTALAGVQHGGVLLGMVVVALAGSGLAGRRLGSLRTWTVGGCIASALALAGLVWAGLVGPGWPLRANVFLLGAANGAFSIAAIGSMMRLAGEGRQSREGMRMGLWGAAQAVAFGLGGLVGTGASDIARWAIASPATAYAVVFSLESMLFLVAAVLAYTIGRDETAAPAGDRRAGARGPLPRGEAAHAATASILPSR